MLLFHSFECIAFILLSCHRILCGCTWFFCLCCLCFIGLFLFLFCSSKQNICHSTAKEYLRAERIFYVYAYISRVSALFGQNLSSQPNLVRIKFHNVNAFNEWLYNRRPSHRINHSKNDDFQFEYGLLYHDACSIPNELLHSNDTIVFAVEIKPKQGWNICRKSDSLLQLLGIGKNVRTKCRFCAMQYLKVILYTSFPIPYVINVN